jgi:hypothetical protein
MLFASPEDIRARDPAKNDFFIPMNRRSKGVFATENLEFLVNIVCWTLVDYRFNLILTCPILILSYFTNSIFVLISFFG